MNSDNDQHKNPAMNYISTRGETAPMGFQDAVLTGLAPDGGLLVPETIPDVRDRLEAWADLSYQDLSFEVLRLFTDFEDDDLRGIIERAYATFRVPEIAPVVEAGPVRILELFHGPTLAFKDMAMQILANVFEVVLAKRDAQLNILGSTSGDTGSAAIHGVRGKERIHIFMMHPDGRTSPLQALQMTSVLDSNVHNMAVDGTFDDCQGIMKSIFRDVSFKEQYTLGAVNSVNWCRVLAQIIYYFYAGLKVQRETGAKRVRFAVPTGNFGNILAGFYAAQMGLPVGKLILATNENDILSRFFKSRDYSRAGVVATLSPSMDIQAASNFERYLYYRLDRDAAKVATVMRATEAGEEFDAGIDPYAPHHADVLFTAGSGDTAATLHRIREWKFYYDYVLDPHTAVGVHVGMQHLHPDEPMVCLATAHPAKFPSAIEDAIGEAAVHPVLDALKGGKTRCVKLGNDESAVRKIIEETVG